jgi:hypothetical protein
MKVEAPGNTTTYLKTCLNNETFEWRGIIKK